VASSMAKHLRYMTRQTVTYGLAPILSRAMGFLLLPLYTRFLSPTDYGSLEIVMLMTAILNLLVGLELRSSLLRIYLAYEEEDDRNETVSTAILLTVGVTSAAALAVDMFRYEIVTMALGNDGAAPLLQLALAILVCTNLSEVLYTNLQARGMSTAYTTLWIVEFSVALILNVAFVGWARQGAKGILLGQLFAVGGVAFGLGAWTLRRVGLRFSVSKVREMLGFGLPLIGVSVSSLAKSAADRTVLTALGPVSEVGLYSLANRFGTVLTVLAVMPFLLFWNAERFVVVRAQDGPRIISRTLTYFAFGLCWGSLAISVWIDEVVQLMTTREFWAAARVVPVLVLGYGLAGVSEFLVTGAFVQRRTGHISMASAVIGVVHIGLCVVLGRSFLGLGIAWANVVTFAIATVAAYLISQRYYPVPFELGRIAKVLMVAAALFASSRLVQVDSPLLGLIMKMPFVAGYPVVLVALGFLNEGERRQLNECAKILWGKVHRAAWREWWKR